MTLVIGVALNLLIGLSGLSVAGSLLAVVMGRVPVPPGMNVEGAAAGLALGIGAYSFACVVAAVGLWRRNRTAWIGGLLLDGLGLGILVATTTVAGLDPILLTGLVVWSLATATLAARPTRLAVSP